MKAEENERKAIFIANKHKNSCIIIKHSVYTPTFTELCSFKEKDTKIVKTIAFFEDFQNIFEQFEVFVLVNLKMNQFEQCLIRKIQKQNIKQVFVLN